MTFTQISGFLTFLTFAIGCSAAGCTAEADEQPASGIAMPTDSVSTLAVACGPWEETCPTPACGGPMTRTCTHTSGESWVEHER